MNSSKGWATSLEQTAILFKQAFGKLTYEELNWSPNAGTWSVAQNIDHLITINRTYFPIMDGMLQGHYKAPLHGHIGFLSDFFGKMILKGAGPDRSRKSKTFPIWEPTQSQLPANILQHFEAHQQELSSYMEKCAPLAHKPIHSPASKMVVYSLGAAFDIMIAHEARHFLQTQETWALNARRAV